MKVATEKPSSPTQTTEFVRESKRQPVWHVFVLHILTLSAYSLVWYYKNVRDIHEFAKEAAQDTAGTRSEQFGAVIKRYEKTQPFLRSAGLVVPLLQLYLVGQFFKDCAELYPVKESFVSQKSLLSGIILTVLMVGLFWLYKLPGAFFLLFLLSAIPMAIAQSWINAFWSAVEEKEKDLMIRHAFSAGELVSIIVGSMVFGLIVVSFFISPNK